MTRYERRRRVARRRRIKAAVFLILVALSVLACAGFNRGVKADGNIVNEPDSGAKQISYIVEAGQDWVADFAGAAEMDVEPASPYTENDVIALAKMAYGGALITRSDTEMSACMWCALNRLDSGNRFYDGCESVYDIVTQKNQFYGYDEGNPVDEHLVWLARDVLTRWVDEHNGAADVGRTLPREYCFFTGDGWHNSFTTEHQGGVEYDWSLPTPYES